MLVSMDADFKWVTLGLQLACLVAVIAITLWRQVGHPGVANLAWPVWLAWQPLLLYLR
jgi:hypothetical protein